MSDTVIINDREFRIGAWYAPKVSAKRRQFLGWFDRGRGWLRYATPRGYKSPCVPAYWAEWAGEEVVP